MSISELESQGKPDIDFDRYFGMIVESMLANPKNDAGYKRAFQEARDVYCGGRTMGVETTKRVGVNLVPPDHAWHQDAWG